MKTPRFMKVRVIKIFEDYGYYESQIDKNICLGATCSWEILVWKLQEQ